MKGVELRILFEGELAFITREVGLDFNQVQISDNHVRFKSQAYWDVRIIYFNENEQSLFVEVLSYNVGQTEFSKIQIELEDKLAQINKITFKSIDTGGLYKSMLGTNPFRLRQPKSENYFVEERESQSYSKFIPEPQKTTYNESFSISIKDIKFKSGRVVFEKKIHSLKGNFEFEIFNQHIIEEYDSIKNYFSNVLQTKKIQVYPNVTVINGDVVAKSATSPEIDKIDNSLIERLKYECIKDLKPKEFNDDKTFYTLEEYIKAIDKANGINTTLFSDASDLFETLIENSNSKHYNQLRYLSSKHQADYTKLRIIDKPLSYLFYIIGIKNAYVLWETIDTEEATYVWSFDFKRIGMDQIFDQIDKYLRLINHNGRNEYIRLKESNFTRVLHDYSDPDKGFKKWKEQIDELLK